MYCNRDDCSNMGLWKPVFTLRPSTSHGLVQSSPMAWHNFFLCTSHKNEATVNDLMGEDTWQIMAQMFEREYHIAPERGRTELEWKAYDPDEQATPQESNSLIIPARFR